MTQDNQWCVGDWCDRHPDAPRAWLLDNLDSLFEDVYQGSEVAKLEDRLQEMEVDRSKAVDRYEESEDLLATVRAQVAKVNEAVEILGGAVETLKMDLE